jgi:hypothetical protein
MSLMCLHLKQVFSVFEVLIVYFVQPLVYNMCEFKVLSGFTVKALNFKYIFVGSYINYKNMHGIT